MAATGLGKTTFAKRLIQLIPEDERLLTIEDARELVVPHRNAVHLLYAKDGQGLAHIGAKQLLESALRMRPDRILLQELRDGTAFFYLRNVNSEASRRNAGWPRSEASALPPAASAPPAVSIPSRPPPSMVRPSILR